MVRIVPRRSRRILEVPRSQLRKQDVPDVLTVREAAALLRVERKTIYELAARGALPGVRRLGRLIRISRSAVMGWLAADGRA
jgi:excisionase family DNA binding protein